MSLHDEFAIIKLIKQTVGKPSRRVDLPIGDDAAVVAPPKKKMVATVDTLVEGVHFDLTYMNANELGHKALAVNLSDIAAMGAEPMYALVSIGLKQELNDFFVEELYRGLTKLARLHGVDIIGGNTVQSPTALVIDVTVIGQSEGDYATRSGAKVGNIIAVTGDLGMSAAGLNCLKRLGRAGLHDYPAIVKAHLTPTPRVDDAMALMGTGGVTAMMDISDGLSRDLHHITELSKVGALIEEDKIPIAAITKKAATLINASARTWALYGGEDYELLVTLDPKKVPAAKKALKGLGRKLTVIGEIRPRDFGVQIKNTAGEEVPLEPRGWNHFARRARAKGDPDPF